MPKRVKYRKWQRGGEIKGVATRGNKVCFGEYGLMSLEHGLISATQIEAGRVTASHFMGTQGRLFIRIFPHKPMTSKPIEVGMGGGKGEPSYYVAVIKPGTIIYEIGGVQEEFARECLNMVAHKMPVRVKMISRK